jgi:hypothetical protein
VHPDPVYGVQQGEIGKRLRMLEPLKVLNRKVSRLGARMPPTPSIQGGAGDGMQKTRISNGSVIITVASAHCDGGTETTAIGSVGDQDHVGAGEASDVRDAGSFEVFGEDYCRQGSVAVASE